jgi:lipopolysaccharide biosynthesis protein
LDYQYVCKIHSKKSLHRHDGDQWRNDLINGLIGSSDIVNRNLIRLEADSRIGILVPKGNILEYKEWIGSNKKIVEDFAKKNKIRFFQEFLFPSGSMFWFRPLVFRQFYNNIDYKMFGIEKGQLDGTMAHSIERLFGLVCHANGYELVETE